MSHNLAIIPTRDRIDLCRKVVTDLLGQSEIDEIFVLDNTNTGELAADFHLASHYPEVVRIVNCAGWSIYQMWNWGLQTAHVLSQYKENVNLAILNDDIDIPDYFISSLVRALRTSDHEEVWCVYPNYRLDKSHTPGTNSGQVAPGTISLTTGTYKHGGMCGWAFMLKAEYMTEELLIDHETFKWWCGDDELELLIRKAGGRVARVEGLGLDHVMSATATLHPELHEIGWQDVARFQEKYGADAW